MIGSAKRKPKTTHLSHLSYVASFEQLVSIKHHTSRLPLPRIGIPRYLGRTERAILAHNLCRATEIQTLLLEDRQRIQGIVAKYASKSTECLPGHRVSSLGRGMEETKGRLQVGSDHEDRPRAICRRHPFGLRMTADLPHCKRSISLSQSRS